MPKSRNRKTGRDHVEAKRRQEQAEELAEGRNSDAYVTPLPTWYKVIMFGLMIVGLLWIIVYYLSGALWPIPNIGGWNIVIGFVIAIVGFLMTTRWR